MVVFSAIFVTDTNIISRYDFVAPLSHGSKHDLPLLYREKQYKEQTNWFGIFITLEIPIEKKLWRPFEKS